MDGTNESATLNVFFFFFQAFLTTSISVKLRDQPLKLPAKPRSDSPSMASQTVAILSELKSRRPTPKGQVPTMHHERMSNKLGLSPDVSLA